MGIDYAHHITNSPPPLGFLDLPTALPNWYSVNIGFIIISSIQICYGRSATMHAKLLWCFYARQLELLGSQADKIINWITIWWKNLIKLKYGRIKDALYLAVSLQ